MTTLEAAIRGGAAALLLLLLLSGLRDAKHSPQARYRLLFDLCALAYLVESAPGLSHGHPWWIAPLQTLSIAAPAVFLLWAQATFDEPFVPKWWRWLPVAGMVALALAAQATDHWLVWRTMQAAALALAAAGIAAALAGRTADLVEPRRRARLVFACGLGACIAITTTLGALHMAALPAVSAVLAIVLAAALLRLRVDEANIAAIATPAATPPPDPVTPEELALEARLLAAMTHDRAYREGGLSVATLAERLSIPEYRLRRLINQRLGHRNFTGFVNAYRLQDATSALADPAQARVPVLTIALDAGFQSIGPFNRAFKQHTGETPTEVRKRRLAEPSPIPESANVSGDRPAAFATSARPGGPNPV